MAIAGLDFKEVADSARGSVGKDGSAQRTFIVPWSGLKAFLAALVPSWTRVSDTNWTYNPGDPHPDFSDMLCESATWTGEGAATRTGNTSSWEQARVVATYKAPSIDNPGGSDPADILEEELDFSVEALPYPEKSLKKVGSDDEKDKISIPQTVLVPVCNYTLTVMDAPTLPGGNASLILSTLGKVNAEAFRGAEKARVLYLGATTSRTTTSTGARGWRIANKFAIRPAGKEWTKVFNPNSGNWDEVETLTGGKKLYEEGNLNAVLPQ